LEQLFGNILVGTVHLFVSLTKCAGEFLVFALEGLDAVLDHAVDMMAQTFYVRLVAC
jgi:hypothetical protein